MNASALSRRLDRRPGGVNVRGDAAREGADNRALDFARNGLHGLEIPLAGRREPRLDHVHLQADELAGDGQFFAQVHGSAGALLPVAQRGVEYNNSVLLHNLNPNPNLNRVHSHKSHPHHRPPAARPGNKKPHRRCGDGVQKQKRESNLNRRAAWKQRIQQQLKAQIHNHAQWIPANRTSVNSFLSEFWNGG